MNAQELAAAGKIGRSGPRPYGYERRYAGEGTRRKMLGDDLHPVEAPIVRELADRCLAGETLRSLCGILLHRGVMTTLGGPWSQQGLRHLLRSARIAGWRELRGELVSEATWPAIISLDEHRQLCALLDSNDGVGRSWARVHPLTGLVLCKRCFETPGRRPVMNAGKIHGVLRYRCRPPQEGGCNGVTIRLAELGDYVDEWCLARLADPDVLSALRARLAARAAAPPRAVLDRIVAGEHRLEALRAQLVTGDPETIPTLTSAVGEVSRSLAADRAVQDQNSVDEPLSALDLEDVARRFVDMELNEKRVILKALIDRIEIGSAQRTGVARGGFDTSRIVVVPA